MKTSGLNFIEAVQAVLDGKCRGIAHRVWVQKNGEQVLCFKEGFLRWVSGSPDVRISASQYTDSLWYLVDPRVPTEDVEVKRWLCTTCGSVFVYPSALACACNRSVLPLVELTGTYQRPVKEKVKRREELICESFTPKSAVVRRHSSQLPGSVRIYAEWEEES